MAFGTRAVVQAAGNENQTRSIVMARAGWLSSDVQQAGSVTVRAGESAAEREWDGKWGPSGVTGVQILPSKVGFGPNTEVLLRRGVGRLRSTMGVLAQGRPDPAAKVQPLDGTG